MFLMKGNQPPGLDEDPPARRGLPENLAVEGAILHVQNALVTLDESALEVEGLLVNVETDDLAFGDVDDGLAVSGEAERRFTIGNGPGFVEAIDEGTVLGCRAAFLEGAAHAQVAIGGGKERLVLGNRLEVARFWISRPVVNRIDVLRREYGFAREHRMKPSKWVNLEPARPGR